VFTRLAEVELIDIAGAFGLGRVVAHRPVSAGTINSNFDVETEQGRYFVRVNEGKAEADVAWEARLVRALAEAGVATVPPVLAGDGRPYAPLAGTRKWVSVFPWRGGRHREASEIDEACAREVGATLARFHTAALALPAAWRRGSIYDSEHLSVRYERIAKQVDPALAGAIEVLGEELAMIAAEAPRRRRAAYGMIHGDLFRDNVLWEGGEVTAILDFEQASGGSLAYDLAVAVNDWCWDGVPRLELAAALVAGYDGVRKLSLADRDALPIEVRAAAARFTITRITDVYLARVHNPEKDFRAFLARCHAWRGPALGQLTSLL
jgi:homoserine kinase type II